MTIEDKARAYDKALEKAGWLEIIDCPKNEALEEIFPQLKDEAEPDFDDEGIRKAIIAHFWTCYKRYGGITFCNYTIAQIISWLKKQGEQKPVESINNKDLSKCSEDIRNFMETFCEDEPKPYWDGCADTLEWIKKNPNNQFCRQKSAEWSEEDESHIGRILSYLESFKAYNIPHMNLSKRKLIGSNLSIRCQNKSYKNLQQ